MAAIAVQELGPYGEGLDNLSFTALSDLANTFVNDGQTILLCKSSSTSAIALSIASVADPYGRLGDIDLPVPIGSVTEALAMSGFLATSLFGSTVDFTVDSTANVSVAAVRVRR